jgi:tellurite resistance protein TerA
MALPPPEKREPAPVTLTRRGRSHSLAVRTGGEGEPVAVHLDWDRPTREPGLLGFLQGLGGPPEVDLDLGCMYRLTTGRKGVVQALGGRLGARAAPPFIALDGDDRGGGEGETLRLFRPELIDLVVVFAMIYEGTETFARAGARVWVSGPEGAVLVPLDAPDPRNTFCAALALRYDGAALRVTREERYFYGHKECDERYGFGFRWVHGDEVTTRRQGGSKGS